MKVNILTQPLFCNYGGILQNYALQEMLRRLGHEPLTINIPPKYPEKPVIWKNVIKTCLNLIRKLRGCYDYPFYNPHKFRCKEFELSFPQRKFVADHISKVDEVLPLTKKVCDKYPAEAWIVGSDQIWRPWCSPNIINSFLDFVPDNVKKLSYAASLGTDEWEINPVETKAIAPLAKKFNKISVRELSGIGLLKENLGVESEIVLDPTLLLNAEDYLNICFDTNKPEEGYIATYLLDIDRNKRKSVKDFSKQKNLNLIEIGKMHKEAFDSVQSWISGIANSEYVITDSFHGTVFSLIFNKPVKILNNSTRGNSRLESLITLLNPILDEEGFYRMADESKEKLEILRAKSIDFLKSSLNSEV